jgi:multiple sugar transport system permease protein
MLIAGSAMFLLPMVFVVTTALMTDQQSLTRRIWPEPFVWSNFLDVFQRIELWRYTINTTLIATLSTFGVVLSSVPVAYALSRMNWRGRQATFILVLATLMLPFQVTIVPLYVIFVRLDWINTLLPLIVPAFFGDAFSIFLLRQFFLTVPEELSDAARVDGATEWQIMTRVIVPLAKPAIAAVALFNFLYNWNDFFGPLYLDRQQQAVDTRPRALRVPHDAQRRVEPHDGRLGAVHGPGHPPVLPRAARVRGGRDLTGVKG